MSPGVARNHHMQLYLVAAPFLPCSLPPHHRPQNPPPWCRAVRCAVPLRLACARARAEPSRGTSRGGPCPRRVPPRPPSLPDPCAHACAWGRGLHKTAELGKHAAQPLPRTPGNRRFNAFWLDPEGGCSPYGLTRDAFNPPIARRMLLRCEVAASGGIEEVTKGGKFSTKLGHGSYAVERQRALSPS